MAVIPDGTKLEGTAPTAGFHGIGATGCWTARFLVNEPKAGRRCFVGYGAAPAVATSSGGSIATPYEMHGAAGVQRRRRAPWGAGS